MKPTYKVLTTSIISAGLLFGLQAFAFTVTPSRGNGETNVTTVCADALNKVAAYSTAGGVPVNDDADHCDATESLNTITSGSTGSYIFVEHSAASDFSAVDLTNVVGTTGYVGNVKVNMVPESDSTGVHLLSEMTVASSGLVSGIGIFITDNLPAVLGVLAALIGLGFLVRHVRKWIGKKA